MSAAHQLTMLSPETSEAHWAHEGEACSCGTGRYYLAHASEPCTCHAPVCECLAEGYAKCDACGKLRQVWPREMVVPWVQKSA